MLSVDPRFYIGSSYKYKGSRPHQVPHTRHESSVAVNIGISAVAVVVALPLLLSAVANLKHASPHNFRKPFVALFISILAFTIDQALTLGYYIHFYVGPVGGSVPFQLYAADAVFFSWAVAAAVAAMLLTVANRDNTTESRETGRMLQGLAVATIAAAGMIEGIATGTTLWGIYTTNISSSTTMTAAHTVRRMTIGALGLALALGIFSASRLLKNIKARMGQKDTLAAFVAHIALPLYTLLLVHLVILEVWRAKRLDADQIRVETGSSELFLTSAIQQFGIVTTIVTALVPLVFYCLFFSRAAANKPVWNNSVDRGLEGGAFMNDSGRNSNETIVGPEVPLNKIPSTTGAGH